MQCVMEVLGPPPASLLEKATRKEQFFEGDGSPRITPNKAGMRRFPATRDLPQALRCNDAPFLSLLQVSLLSCYQCHVPAVWLLLMLLHLHCLFTCAKYGKAVLCCCLNF